MEQYKFMLFADDSCDLPPEYFKANNIGVMYLSSMIDGKSYTSLELSPQDFYAEVRAGKMPTTSQVNVDKMLEGFEPVLQDGHDILYITLSSGLSSSFSSTSMAVKELEEKYPDRKIFVMDSLCASMGQGLLVHKVNEMRKSGATIEETAQWISDHRLNVSHMVAVDDLMHLHRGGRVSKTSAVAGSLLGIKPVIHMNDAGKLIAIDKVRGRKQSLQDIVNKTAKLIGSWDNDIFMVSHSDCEEDAKYVAELVKEKLGIKQCLINYIGPVIGTHTGTGTVALFVMAEHR